MSVLFVMKKGIRRSIALKLKNKIGKKIKILISDNGGEYTSDLFFKVCKKE